MNTLLFLGGIGLPEILVIALVVLLLFGGKKIPELMRGLGKGVKNFKEGMNGVTTATRRMTDESMSFWEHLDALRAAIMRSVVVALLFTVAAFVFKTALFDIVLAPKSDDFITYRLLGRLSEFFGGQLESFSVKLINTGLAQQFVAHLQMALCMGVVCASPYVVYQFFHSVSPALYDNERHYARLILPCAYLLFFVGVLSSYFLLFPLTFRFLGTY